MKKDILKGLAVMLLVFASMTVALAQENSDPTQEVCPGVEPYLITPGNTGNTFLWSIGSGRAGTDWTIESPTTAATNITWGQTTSPQTYVVTFREVDPETGCYDEVALTVTVNPEPEAPEGDPITACETNPIQSITALATAPEGATVVWYSEATGGEVVNDPTLSEVGTITYYAESQSGTCASSTRTPIILTITPAPLAPEGEPITVCATGEPQTITAEATAAEGAIIVWYSELTGGDVVAEPTLSAVGTVTYYAEAQMGDCVSPRTPVVLTITPAPLAPEGEDITACETNPVQTLTAQATVPEGVTLVWYDAPTGGEVVNDPTLNEVGTITYYAEAQIGDCVSPRTPIVLTIEPFVAPTIGGLEEMCALTEGNVYTTEAGMTNYVWVISAGGTITAGGGINDNTVTVTWNEVGPQTVSVNYENDEGCSASTPTVVGITVNPIPSTSPIFHN